MFANFHDEPLYAADDIKSAFCHYPASDAILEHVLCFVNHAVKQPPSDKATGLYSISDLVHIYMEYGAADGAKEAVLYFLSHLTGQPACALDTIERQVQHG